MPLKENCCELHQPKVLMDEGPLRTNKINEALQNFKACHVMFSPGE